MACVGTTKTAKGERRYIQFVDGDGRRKTIRLGKVDQRTAEAICRHVEALLAAKIAGQPIPRPTAVWLGEISPVLRDRLARAGLIAAESQPQAKLGDYLRRSLKKDL